MPDIISQDLRHVFNPQEISKFNTSLVIPLNLFANKQGSYFSIRKEVLAAQSISKIGKSLVAALSSGKKPRDASFSLAGDEILHNDKLWIPVP